MVILVVVVALTLVLDIMGLVGTIKEHLCITITMTVLNAIGVIYYFIASSYLHGVVGIGTVVLSGIYAYMISNRPKPNIINTSTI